jgi:hypothetical protein
MPTWILSMTMLLASMMVFMAGVILDSVARSRNEQKRIHYLSIAPSRGEGTPDNALRLHGRHSAAISENSTGVRRNAL